MSRRGNTRVARQKRHARIRQKLNGDQNIPRLCVYRSLHHVYAQLIDDTKGHTVVSASSLDPEVKAEVDGKTKTHAARAVGLLLGNRAKGEGMNKVVFDRGGYKYHGRVKALAEAAREAGLEF